MKNLYFTIGPTQLYPTVKKHLYQAIDNELMSLSHRSSKFQEIYQSTVTSLKKLLNLTDDHHVFFLSSSLEAMERIIENTAGKYSFHLINGAFSRKFF